MPDYICKTCTKDFFRSHKSYIYKFCSRKCANNQPRKPRKDFIYRDGYRYVKMWLHSDSAKQGYIAEHRLVMEKMLGRRLTSREVVHHINENKEDNRPENLQLFASRGQHTKLGHSDLYEKQKELFKGKRFSPNTEFKKGNIPHNKKPTR